jgi:hypothetical protein
MGPAFAGMMVGSLHPQQIDLEMHDIILLPFCSVKTCDRTETNPEGIGKAGINQGEATGRRRLLFSSITGGEQAVIRLLIGAITDG